MSVGGANTRTVASGLVGPVCSVTVLLLCLKMNLFKKKKKTQGGKWISAVIPGKSSEQSHPPR